MLHVKRLIKTSDLKIVTTTIIAYILLLFLLDWIILSDFVKFAYAKGLPNRRIVFIHVLKNVLVPVVTILGLEFGNLIAFSVVTESVFAWPGIGKVLIESIENLDRPVIVAYLFIVAVMFTVANMIVDILYSILDPRVTVTEMGN